MARPAAELLDPSGYGFVHEVRTRYADVDPQNHINNVAMAAVFEDARVQFDGMSGARSRYATLRVMIASAYIDYLAEAHFPGSLFVHLAVLDVGRSSWTLAQLAVQDGRPRAVCRATMVARNAQGAAPLPDDLRAALDGHRLGVAGAR